jgi:ribosome modulation factor
VFNRTESKFWLRRDLPETVEGQITFEMGESVDDCPYPKGDFRRQSWMTGWYDSRTTQNCAVVFANHGVLWP